MEQYGGGQSMGSTTTTQPISGEIPKALQELEQIQGQIHAQIGQMEGRLQGLMRPSNPKTENIAKDPNVPLSEWIGNLHPRSSKG